MQKSGNTPFRKLTFLLILALNTMLADYCYSQTENYREIFGKDWQDAEEFLRTNERWMKSALEKYDIPYPEASAIIFPELVRYSALRDRMETAMLKTLYRNLGEEYADFSVGRFQMKPSFAEKIHLAAGDSSPRKIRMLFLTKGDFTSMTDYRSYVIDEIENPETALNYIIAFYLITVKQYSVKRAVAEERIRLLSASYNSGFWKSRMEIERLTERNFFSTRLFGGEKYSYSDISLYWYENSGTIK